MTRLTRRTFGLAALGAPALLATQPAQADGHSARAAGPGAYSAPLGAYTITALFDGMVPLQKSFFFGSDQSQIDATLAATGVTGDLLAAPVNAFLLQSADRTILIDAGMGDMEIMGPGFGKIAGALASVGVSPADVDLLVVTHAHPDHIGGMVSNGEAVFANAELVVSTAEHAFWTDDGILAQAPAQTKGLFGMARGVFEAYGNRMKLVAAGTEIAPGLTLELSPGHTMGHSIVHIDGGDRELLMVADSLHNADLHTALPQTGFGFDTDPELAAQSRIRLLDRGATDGILIAGSHLHFPGFGRFARSGDAYRYHPASWL